MTRRIAWTQDTRYTILFIVALVLPFVAWLVASLINPTGYLSLTFSSDLLNNLWFDLSIVPSLILNITLLYWYLTLPILVIGLVIHTNAEKYSKVNVLLWALILTSLIYSIIIFRFVLIGNSWSGLFG